MQCEELPRARHGDKDKSWAEKAAKINMDPTQLSHGSVSAFSKNRMVLLSRSDDDDVGALIVGTGITAQMAVRYLYPVVLSAQLRWGRTR